MTVGTERIFGGMARRPYASWMRRIEGRLRFDVICGPAAEHWMLTVGDGQIHVSRENAAADAVITTDGAVLEAMAAGRTRPIAAFLRNDIAVKGSFRYVLLLDRLLPGGPEYQAETTGEDGHA